MVLLLKTIPELRSQISFYRAKELRNIGLVPTMGALHQGHQSLIKKAIADCDLVVVSIFVNPLQFSPTEDLADYPRQLEQDLQLCEKLGVAIAFAPDPQTMNSDGDTQTLTEITRVIPPQTMTEVLCGRYREGHFTGVATIVTKLLNIIEPDRAYFGQKDAQQLAIIRRLVDDLNIPVEIVPCPIIRESSGLALSSRNQYLTEEETEQAANIYRSLQQAKTAFGRGEINSQTLINLVKQELKLAEKVKIQYVELVDPINLQALGQIEKSGLLAIAAYLGSTRLIDNIVLQKRQPIVAIDGPAGAGKSTVTRRVAHELGLLYLDTGAMYRAVTWLVMNSDLALDDEGAIALLIKDVEIQLTSPNAVDLPTVVHIDDKEVTTAIRTPEVTANVSAIAAQAAVRGKLVQMQQQWGEKGGIIAEGRDIGTNVFPNAELKVFMTASVEERARRRWQDLQNQGRDDIDLQQLAQDIQRRDELDSNRAIAPLKKADDAIELITDDLTIDEVIAKIIELYQQTI
ncbi:bifunctional pantoate--beta-alanine ligase/(d)CMP kinase [Waterburya agarophytonicola K14]|uniref:Bifunctional pantoate ligase/cytidylate kinase n=1 Tax=Waterburya agarophytonicola KI4 TaxID=2874699 RepID=A0A964BTR9_9CYAN|nr:bifunctional pantoate--beta-alanine ligase/(d)CMP kinase [Waterburya agarophytonicola]MCC0178716.1 bifunctional pantoate--beta-alanine ligase/(d)CMP kinase [Waterburya agarophytonicola KI4]